MKHIKLTGTLVERNTKVCVKIKDLTHWMKNFSLKDHSYIERDKHSWPDFCNGYNFIATNGVRLKSGAERVRIDTYNVPPSEFNGLFTFYVGNGSSENNVCIVSLDEWELIKEAIKEYNEFHSKYRRYKT